MFHRLAFVYIDAIMADPDPGPSPFQKANAPYRICKTCPTRLPAVCYDRHTLCSKCRNKVCTRYSFCDECRDWSPEFREVYATHSLALRRKRVSKVRSRSRPKSSPIVDDSSSVVSDDSDAPHVIIDVSGEPIAGPSVSVQPVAEPSVYSVRRTYHRLLTIG